MDKMAVSNFPGNMWKVSLSSEKFIFTLYCLVLHVCVFNKYIFPFAEGISNADLVLLVTTRPTTGNTLAWAVACERDQWGRAVAGNFLHDNLLS